MIDVKKVDSQFCEATRAPNAEIPPSWLTFSALGHKLFSLALILLAGITDALTPLGVAVGVLYVLPIISTLPLYNPTTTRLMALTTISMILTGYWISPAGGLYWMVITNRVLSILAVGGTYFIVIQAIQASETSKIMSKILEREQTKQTVILEEKHRAMLNLLEDFAQARKWIEESKERFDLAISGTNDGIWDWTDVTKDHEWWSPQLYGLLGYQPDEFSPCRSKFKDMLHPDDHERTFQLLQDHFDKNEPYDIEYRLLTKSGDYRWFHGRGNTLRDKTRRPLRMTGSIQDITTRKEAEDAFLQLNRYHSLILASAGEGIYGLDLQGKSTFVNPAAATMLGYEPEELIGCPMHVTIHHTKQDGSPYPPKDCPMYMAYRDGSVYHVEEEVLWRKNGTSLQVDYTSTPIRGKHNELLGAVVVFKDTTLRHQVEVEREQFISKLEQTNTELEQFTYTVSHDLKSPLVTIRGFIGYVQKGLIENNREQIESDLKRIDTAAEKMQILLENLHALSRVGKGVGSFEDLDLHDVAQEALELTTGFLERGSHVRIHISSALPTVQGDRIRLVELFQNLLENAFKFLGQQVNPCIEVDARQDDEAQVILVRDNGIGIKPAYHTKVFEIFERLQTTIPGTGVGLALAKRIVMLHHGRIWIESDGYGKGTTVCMIIPVSTKG